MEEKLVWKPDLGLQNVIAGALYGSPHLDYWHQSPPLQTFISPIHGVWMSIFVRVVFIRIYEGSYGGSLPRVDSNPSDPEWLVDRAC
jgi:hypothetical protein